MYKRLIYGGSSLILIIVIWKILAMKLASPVLLPTPEYTLSKLVDIVRQKEFINIVMATLKRVLISFSISLVLGAVLAYLSHIFEIIKYMIWPLVSFMKATPVMAFILLLMIWTRAYAPVIVGTMMAFPIIYGNILTGLGEVDEQLLEMAKSFDVDRGQIVKNIYIPSITPYAVAGMTSAFSISFKALIAAEVLVQPKLGIGTVLQNGSMYFETETVFAWVGIILAIAMGFDIVLKRINLKFRKWSL